MQTQANEWSWCPFLFDLDTGFLDHLLPAIRFPANEYGELLGSIGDGVISRLLRFLLDRGLAQDLHHLGVDLVDDRLGRTLGRDEPKPDRDVVEVGQVGGVRQRRDVSDGRRGVAIELRERPPCPFSISGATIWLAA